MLKFFSRCLCIYKISFLVEKFIRKIKILGVVDSFKKCDISVHFGKVGELRGVEYIEIGKNTWFGDEFYLTAWNKYREYDYEPSIIIGDNCGFNSNTHITSINRIVIGNNVLTGKCVTITDNSHGEISAEGIMKPPYQRPIVSKGPVIIEDNVWIGDKATVLPNVHIGKNAIVGANSVVTHDVPAFTVVAGNPARVIKRILQPSFPKE